MTKQKDFQLAFEAQRVFFGDQKTKPLSFRLKSMKALKVAIKQFEPDIMEALRLDLHKSGFESYITEIGFVLEELSYQISQLKRWVKPSRVCSGLTTFPSSSRVVSEPLGQVLIIAPWNYPFQLMMTPLIGAIAAGNTVFLKPSELSSNTANIIDKIISSTFLPEFVTTIQGDATVTQSLLKLKFDHVFFTGSPRVGQIVMEQAAKQLTPVTLELGGKSPCIVDCNISIQLAAKRIVWGKFLNAGQTCIAPDYLLVHESIADELLIQLVKVLIEFYGDDPSQSMEYPRIINEANVHRLESFMKGCTCYHGGTFVSEKKYVAPTILTDVSPELPIMQQEIFGPLLPVLTYSAIDEAIDFVNGRPKPLALYCFSEDRKVLQRIINEVSAGGVTINDTLMHIGNNKMPFGGVGNSGMGSYHGKYSFDTFSHKKAVMIRGTWLDVPLRYAPFKNKIKYIKMLMK